MHAGGRAARTHAGTGRLSASTHVHYTTRPRHLSNGGKLLTSCNICVDGRSEALRSQPSVYKIPSVAMEAQAKGERCPAWCRSPAQGWSSTLRSLRKSRRALTCTPGHSLDRGRPRRLRTDRLQAPGRPRLPPHRPHRHRLGAFVAQGRVRPAQAVAQMSSLAPKYTLQPGG